MEATKTMEAVARSLNMATESIRAMIEQQRDVNEQLEEVVVALGGSPPKPPLRLVDVDDA